MRKYNINANIIQVFENIYDMVQSVVLFNCMGIRTTVRRCLLSLTFINIFLEKVMSEVLEDHESKQALEDIPSKFLMKIQLKTAASIMYIRKILKI